LDDDDDAENDNDLLAPWTRILLMTERRKIHLKDGWLTLNTRGLCRVAGKRRLDQALPNLIRLTRMVALELEIRPDLGEAIAIPRDSQRSPRDPLDHTQLALCSRFSTSKVAARYALRASNYLRKQQVASENVAEPSPGTGTGSLEILLPGTGTGRGGVGGSGQLGLDELDAVTELVLEALGIGGKDEVAAVRALVRQHGTSLVHVALSEYRIFARGGDRPIRRPGAVFTSIVKRLATEQSPSTRSAARALEEPRPLRAAGPPGVCSSDDARGIRAVAREFSGDGDTNRAAVRDLAGGLADRMAMDRRRP